MKKFLKLLLIILLIIGTNLITFGFVTKNFLGAEDQEKFLKIKLLENKIKKDYLYEVSDEDLRDGELKGMVAALKDPYSEYLTEEDLKEMNQETSGSFYGIGFTVYKNENNQIEVVSPIKDTPADRAGIKSKDIVVKVNGKNYTGDEMKEAIKVIKGEKGSTVHLTIYRPSTKKTLEMDVERAEIKIETVISHKIENLGYIGIIQFNDHTDEEFKTHLDELQKQNVKGLIIDLRGNPGGTVSSVVKIADMLLPEGTIVSAKDKNHKIVFEYKSDKDQYDKPIVVLINEGSASASEILSGAIKDFNRGKLVGVKSFGKGIVQTVFPFQDGTGVKLTTSEYFTPSGENIHNIGIKPDFEVKLKDDVKGIGYEYLKEDTQLQKAIEVLKKEV